MAYTPEAIAKADAQKELSPVGISGPWHIYEIPDTAIVEPLAVQPVVVNERPGDKRERWLEIGTSYFQHTNEWAALPVDHGPEEWQRIDVVSEDQIDKANMTFLFREFYKIITKMREIGL